MKYSTFDTNENNSSLNKCAHMFQRILTIHFHAFVNTRDYVFVCSLFALDSHVIDSRPKLTLRVNLLKTLGTGVAELKVYLYPDRSWNTSEAFYEASLNLELLPSSSDSFDAPKVSLIPLMVRSRICSYDPP